MNDKTPDITDTYHARAVYKRRLEALDKPLNGLDLTSNKDPLIAELWRAREAASFTAAWKKDVTVKLIEEFDLAPLIEVVDPGSIPANIVTGGVFGIQCTRKRPASRIDYAVFRSALRKAGVGASIIDACSKEATKFNKPSTTIEAVWLTN